MHKVWLITSTLFLMSWLGNPLARATEPDHLRQLLNTGSCVQCDLRRVGLVLADLETADLQDANLFGANLSRANLAGADLSNTNLSGANLFGANLMGVDLSGANLTGADLRQAYMLGAILNETQLDYANLQGAIGLPDSAGQFEDFHNWGVASAQLGKHEEALEYYNQAIARNPEFALTYLSRAISRQNLHDTQGAIEDSKVAAELFEAQENPQSAEMAENLVLALEASLDAEPKTGGFMGFLRNTTQSLMPLVLRFLPL